MNRFVLFSISNVPDPDVRKDHDGVEKTLQFQSDLSEH